MAAPTEAIEQSVNVRKFSGVNTQYDPVFIGGQFLKASQNLFPNFTYRLSKRYGSPIYKTIPGCVGISDILATSYQGHAYFFAYAQTITQDTVVLFIDDGPQINLYLSPHSQLTGRFIRYGAFVYMGNGMDPIQQLVMD